MKVTQTHTPNTSTSNKEPNKKSKMYKSFIKNALKSKRSTQEKRKQHQFELLKNKCHPSKHTKI